MSGTHKRKGVSKRHNAPVANALEVKIHQSKNVDNRSSAALQIKLFRKSKLAFLRIVVHALYLLRVTES
jgi:hypothetical protein